MNRAHTFTLIAGLLGSALATMLFVGQGDHAPAPDQPVVAGQEWADGAEPMVTGAGADAMQRSAIPLPDGAPGDAATLAQAAIAVSGRVTDHLGNPIAAAKVRVQQRQGFAGPGGAGPGGNGNGNRGAAGPGNRNGQGSQRGQRRQGSADANPGDALAATDQRQANQAQNRFRLQPVGEVVVTGSDGRYRLLGSAYTTANLTIAVTHDQYAPTVVRRDWQSKMGELPLADIVLKNGVLVSGVVVDENEQPLAGAQVAYERAQDDPSAGQPGNSNGRGNRGGFGRDPLQDLIAAAVTDASGAFQLGPLPIEPFQLVASAAQHLDGHSRRIEPAGGQQQPPVKIVELNAVGLTGVVRDSAGQPVAGAVINGEISREAMIAEFRAQLPAPAPTDPQANRGGGRRGQGNPQAGQAGGGPDFNRMREVMAARETTRSNERGEFRLEKLPRAQVRLTAEHPRYLTTTQEPIDAAQNPAVVIVMPATLSASGIVVDAGTGQPVAAYGIAARRVGQQNGPQNDPLAGWFGRGGQGPGGQGPQRGGAGRPIQDAAPPQTGNDAGRTNRGPRNRNVDPTQQPPAAVAATPQTAAREAWLRELLGPSGRIPGRTPEPAAHAGGAFEVDKLQVGDYEFDVDAPGYVKVASEVVHVTGPDPIAGLVFSVAPGAVVRGRVEQTDHTPIAGAAVELLLPDPPTGVGPVQADTNGGRGGPAGVFGAGGPGGRGQRLARTVTDSKGTFALPPLHPGTFRLRVQADGMMDFSDPSFVLPAAGSVREVTLTMTTGGTVFGVVKNLTPGAGARVLLTHTADHSRHTGAVDATTAEYRIVGLPAGGYFVNLMQFGDDDARRRMLANELAQRNRPSPDLAVQAGTSTRYDLIAGRDPLGSVAGTVMLNGIAAVGMQVRLNRLAEPNAAPRDSNAQDNQLANMTDQLLRATVDSNGAFTITTIPPGNYTAEVLRANGGGGRGGNFGGPPGGNNFGGRGLRGGGGVVDRQPLTILAFVQSSVQFDLRTSEVEFRLTLPDAIAATARTRIALALASEVGSQEPQQWRRLDSFRMLMIQNGTTGPQALAPGAYRYEAGGRGVQSQVGDLVVVAGQPQTLNLTMLAAPEGGPPDGSQPGGNPGNNPGGNAAPGPGGPGTPAAGNNPRAPGTPGAGNNPGAPGTPDAGNNPGGRGNNRRQGQRGQGGSPPNGGGSNNPPGGG